MRYPSLNLRAINPGGYVDLAQTDVLDAAEELSAEYLTQVGDIVVRLTAPYTAVLIDASTAGMVISSNFIIIRTEGKKLLPEYLFWILNTPKVKRAIYENTSSNMLGAIKAGFFSAFELDVPAFNLQQKIADIHQLAMKEAQLLRSLANEKERYYGLMVEQIHNKQIK